MHPQAMFSPPGMGGPPFGNPAFQQQGGAFNGNGHGMPGGNGWGAQAQAPVPSLKRSAPEEPSWQGGGGNGWSGGGDKSWNADAGKSDWQQGGSNDWKSGGESWEPKPKWNDWKAPAEEVEEEDEDLEARPHGFAFIPAPAPGAFPEELTGAIRKAREQMEVVVKGEPANVVVPPITAFNMLDGVLPGYVSTSLASAGIVAPVPIQQQTLPFALSGFDVIGIAKTGSGKTLAFLLPAIAHCERMPPMPEGQAVPTVVVLAPVRELAVQIGEEAVKIVWNSGKTENHPNGIGCVSVYGGGGAVRQKQLRQIQEGFAHIVVGTPGRMCDFVASGDLKLHQVQMFVLDEADRMLEGGFEDQMNDIGAAIPEQRQTMFFSATWPKAVRKLGKNMCRAPPIRVNVGQIADDTGGPAARGDIRQEVIVFDGGPRRPWPDDVANQIIADKTARMNAHMRGVLSNPICKLLVFVNTKDMAWELSEQLQGEGFAADFMTSNRSQNERHECIRKFKEGETKLVVTTDVMARGLDIPGITHVVVYDCYGGIDDYVHRIGRTARGFDGSSGHALVFFEFDPKFAGFAGELITLLQGAGQVVPAILQQIADDVESGVRKAILGKQKGKKPKKW